jgi:exopolysaccharide production protein ExoZ
MADSHKYVSVQILRAVAAMMVVAFHLPHYLRAPPEQDLPILFGGVDLFFVISGFVMMASTQARRGRGSDLASFAGQRLWRIVPLYWLGTLVFIAILASNGRLVRWDEILRSLLFIPYYDPAMHLVQPVLAVGWTLNIEMLFYGVFAATLFLRPWRQVMAIAALFGVAVGLRIVMKPATSSVLFFYTSPMLFEFVAGMVVALATARLRQLPLWSGVVLIAIGASAAVGLGLSMQLPRSMALGGPAALLVIGAVIIDHALDARAVRPLALLGDASYSMYLTHLMVLSTMAPLALALPPWLGGPTLFAACLATAVAVYLGIERPLLRMRRVLRFPGTSSQIQAGASDAAVRT